jgi:hypothetical protein
MVKEKKDFELYKYNANDIIKGFFTQEQFEVSQTAGKYIPFGFVAGNNVTTQLNVIASFGLKNNLILLFPFQKILNHTLTH